MPKSMSKCSCAYKNRKSLECRKEISTKHFKNKVSLRNFCIACLNQYSNTEIYVFLTNSDIVRLIWLFIRLSWHKYLICWFVSIDIIKIVFKHNMVSFLCFVEKEISQFSKTCHNNMSIAGNSRSSTASDVVRIYIDTYKYANCGNANNLDFVKQVFHFRLDYSNGRQHCVVSVPIANTILHHSKITSSKEAICIMWRKMNLFYIVTFYKFQA